MEDILKCSKNPDQDDYYAILGCDESSTAEQISSEFKARSLDCHPDKNIGDPAAVCKFQKLVEAKEVLTNKDLRCIYDKWRNSGICMPFSQFRNLSRDAHTSIHWAVKKNKELMIEGQCSSQAGCSQNEGMSEMHQIRKPVFWEKEKGNALLQKFRNYEL